ncbi:Lrp/AsnC family transcriptional regulator [Streptomyces aureus]
MTQDSMHALDHVDQALVHALQIAPRAGWARIGAALGMDAVTVARRWNRLTDTGAAWISCHPAPAMATSGQGCLAFVEVDCANGSLPSVARELAEERHVSAVAHVSGDRDLLLTVMAPDQVALTRWVTHRLGSMDGIVTTRTHLASTVYAEGAGGACARSTGIRSPASRRRRRWVPTRRCSRSPPSTTVSSPRCRSTGVPRIALSRTPAR